jgi:hypothetical protein
VAVGKNTQLDFYDFWDSCHTLVATETCGSCPLRILHLLYPQSIFGCNKLCLNGISGCEETALIANSFHSISLVLASNELYMFLCCLTGTASIARRRIHPPSND